MYYTVALEGINWAVSHDLDVTILTVFNPKNIDEYSGFFDLLEQLGWLKSERLKLQFNLEINEKGYYETDKALIIESLEAFNELRRLDVRANNVSINRFFPGSDFLIQNLNDSRNDYHHIYRCDCLATPSYSFNPDGKVYLCSLVAKDYNCIGEYRSRTYIDYSKIQLFRRRNTTEMVRCSSCKWKLACGGGCFIAAAEKENDISAPSCGIWHDFEKNEQLGLLLNEILLKSNAFSIN